MLAFFPMRISLPAIPSRWETIEELLEAGEPFNTNCSTMYDDCMQSFHDDESESSDEDICEDDHDQAKFTPVKVTGDTFFETSNMPTPAASPNYFLSAEVNPRSNDEPKSILSPAVIPQTPSTPKTSIQNLGLPTPTASPSFSVSSQMNNASSSSRQYPLPSDKDQWFENWQLDKQKTYDIKSHLPYFIKTNQIEVEVAGLLNIVFYDAREAIMRYEDPGEYVQGVVRVHIRAPEFELHDSLLVFNEYPSPPFVPQPLNYGPFLGEIASMMAAKKKAKSKGKGTAHVDPEETSTSQGTGDGQTHELAEDGDLIRWIQANNIDMKFPPLFTYVYEFQPANTDLKIHSVVLVDSGSAATQNEMMFQPPCPPRVFGHATVYDSAGGSTQRRYGAGSCFPVKRVRPSTSTASPFRVSDWTVVGDNQKFQDPEFLARAKEHGSVEPICAERGPLLIGLGNLMRWNLVIHPRNGLEFA